MRRCKVLDVGYAGLMHDFTVTDRHLLFVMPPLLIDREKIGRQAFLDSLDWRPDAGLRLVLVDKADLTVVRQTIVPARFVFHLRDAWEDAGGTVFCDVVTFPDADIVQHDLAAIMDAKMPGHPRSSFERLAWPATGPARLEPSIDLVGVEFPRWAEGGEWFGAVGPDAFRHETAGRLVQHASVGGQGARRAPALGGAGSGAAGGASAGWALCHRDRRGCHSGHSFLHLFAADAIADGPIAWVELPVALPVGLHANVRLHQGMKNPKSAWGAYVVAGRGPTSWTARLRRFGVDFRVPLHGERLDP